MLLSRDADFCFRILIKFFTVLRLTRLLSPPPPLALFPEDVPGALYIISIEINPHLIRKVSVVEDIKKKFYFIFTRLYLFPPHSHRLTLTALDESDLLSGCNSWAVAAGRLENEPLERTFFNRWCFFFRFVVVAVDDDDAPDGKGIKESNGELKN